VVNLGLFIFFSEDGDGFYFFIFLKGGGEPGSIQIFFQRRGTGFVFSFF